MSDRNVDWRSVLQALLALVAVRAGLWLLPFRLVRRLVPTVSSNASESIHGSADIAAAEAIARVARNIGRASRYVPAASCLTQALAAQWLLARAALPSTLNLGVARSPDGLGIKAHAWLECQGMIVTGGAEAGDYSPLPELPPPSVQKTATHRD